MIDMSHLFYRFSQGQQTLSKYFDRLLPVEYQVDGNRDFVDHWIEPYLRRGSIVYDVGGGKNPVISLDGKRRLGLRLRVYAPVGELISPARVHDSTMATVLVVERDEAGFSVDHVDSVDRAVVAGIRVPVDVVVDEPPFARLREPDQPAVVLAHDFSAAPSTAFADFSRAVTSSANPLATISPSITSGPTCAESSG